MVAEIEPGTSVCKEFEDVNKLLNRALAKVARSLLATVSLLVGEETFDFLQLEIITRTKKKRNNNFSGFMKVYFYKDVVLIFI
jgi:hypothetical protein